MPLNSGVSTVWFQGYFVRLSATCVSGLRLLLSVSPRRLRRFACVSLTVSLPRALPREPGSAPRAVIASVRSTSLAQAPSACFVGSLCRHRAMLASLLCSRSTSVCGPASAGLRVHRLRSASRANGRSSGHVGRTQHARNLVACWARHTHRLAQALGAFDAWLHLATSLSSAHYWHWSLPRFLVASLGECSIRPLAGTHLLRDLSTGC